ncbi:pol, partial [Symbiodinium microadriaticum]
MDYFLSPLSDRFDELFPGWTCPNLGLPHFIIYADDIMLFADTPVALQFKLQEVVDVLSTIGLSVNPDKSRVMSLHDGSHPGIWLRGRALPLQVESALVFLGIPLAHTNNVQSIMSHLMRRTSNAYYGFKRVMDAGEAPISVRLHIFETFITAKWAWASPVMVPTRAMLRRLEAAKTTFLLSLFRVPTDPLLTWVENVVSRRRAVKTVCKHNGGPDWRVTWLKRLWQYLGHLSRTSHRQLMKRLLNFCSSALIGPNLRPAWLSDLMIRRVQRVYSTWPWAAAIPYWEQFARDRTQWSNHRAQWVNHWIDKDVEGLATFEYLYDRQLLVVRNKKGILDCMLRPSKDFFEEPYGVAMLAYKVLGIFEHFGKTGDIVLPPQYLHRAVFHRHVLEVASSLAKEVGGPVALGAFVRVKAGVRVLSRMYPETTKLLTAFLASEFPGDFFLAIQVQVDVDKPPHKDVRNTSMPTLLVNLSEGAPGGTWVEAPNGDEVVRCPDG